MSQPAKAQSADTLESVLPDVLIEATRATETSATAPFAVAVRHRSPAAVALDPGLSLETVLAGMPGLSVNDRTHAALGERLLIRGMGWQAAFGVRGAHVLLDGLPLTMPDGQAVLDIVDPAFVQRVELLRGPASLFWGNGSGGVLFLSTDDLTDTLSGRLRVLGGSYGLRQVAATASAPAGRHRLQVFASDTRRGGYRRHSDSRFTRAGLHGNISVGPRTRLRLAGAFADQDALSPGQLTESELNADRRLADERYVGTRAGKKSLQAQLGLTLYHDVSFGDVTATAYGLHRDLDNPLPFAFIQLDRRAAGTRFALRRQRGSLGFSLGFDAAWQWDDRQNYDNADGVPGTERNLDQRETVRHLAAFGVLTTALTDRLSLTAGLRASELRFASEDRLLANGDQSGHRTFSAWSPSLGLSYRLNSILLFAGYSTVFETPTTTELVNRPDLTGGFNPEIGPQRGNGFEVGARGVLPWTDLHVDLALFHLALDDRIVPFQTADGGDRTFYRNAGGNTHDGLEIALDWRPDPALRLRLTYTVSRFVFNDAPLNGNRTPGLPAQRLFAELRLTSRGVWTRLTVTSTSSYFVDDENLNRNDGYAGVDVYAGHKSLTLGPTRLQPFVKMGNVLDRAFNGSVVINARGGQFFEPAPGRTLEAGLNIVL